MGSSGEPGPVTKAGQRAMRYFAPPGNPATVGPMLARIETEAMLRERERIASAVESMPSRAMDTLVPNTGPDVVERGELWAVIEDRP